MRVAVSGGIAEGKSTVLATIRSMGHEVASSDEIARDVLDQPETLAEVTAKLCLPPSPTRDEIRQKIAQDPAARRALNQVTHPKIVQALAQHPARFVEIPLLLETCLYGMFDRVWIVTCGREEQMARLQRRYGTREIAERLAASQLDSEMKMAFADAIIRTNDPVETVSEVVAGLVTALKEGQIVR